MSGVQTVNETPLQRHWRKKRELKQTKRETGLNNHKNNRTKAIFGDITNVQNTKVTPLKRVFRDIQNTVTQTQYICEMQPITEPKRKKRRRALRKKKQNQDTTVNISITKSNKPIHITQTKSKNNKVFSNSKKRIQKPKPTEIKKQFSKLSDTEKIVELQHRLRKKTLDLTKSKITIKKNNKLISTLTARSKHQQHANTKKSISNKVLKKQHKTLLKDNKILKSDINTLSNQLSEILTTHDKCTRSEKQSLKDLLNSITEYIASQKHTRSKPVIQPKTIEKYDGDTIREIEQYINTKSSNTQDIPTIYHQLAKRNIPKYQPRISLPKTVQITLESGINQSQLDSLQKGIRSEIGWPLFVRHDLVTLLLTNSNLKSQDVVQVELERSHNSEAYKRGNHTILTNVFVVECLDEALCLNVKNNIDGGKYCLLDGFEQDTWWWAWGGDSGKGKTSISLATFTREHPNSKDNSVVIVCYEAPAVESYNNLKHFIPYEQTNATMNGAMWIAIVVSDGQNITSHIGLLRLDYWGQQELNVLQEAKHVNSIPEQAPTNGISALEYEYYKHNARAHYETGALRIISVDDLCNITSNYDWFVYCKYRDSKTSQTNYLMLNDGVLPKLWSGIVAIKDGKYIQCILRLRMITDNKAAVYGRGKLYSEAPVNDVSNFLLEENKSYIARGTDDMFQQPNGSVNSELKMFWTSKKCMGRLCGDKKYLSMVIGHSIHSNFPSLWCDVEKCQLRSGDNQDGSVQSKCNYRSMKSMMNDYNTFEKTKSLKKSHGIKCVGLIRYCPWNMAPPTYHDCEGIFFKIQAATDNGVRTKLGIEIENKDEGFDKLVALKDKKIELEHSLTDYNHTKMVLDTTYGCEDIEMEVSMCTMNVQENINNINEKIEQMKDNISPHETYNIIKDYQNQERLIQYNYKSGSVKGIIIKNNIKCYHTFGDLIANTVYQQLGEDYVSLMDDFSHIYSKISCAGNMELNQQRKKEKRQLIYGDKMSQEEQNTLKKTIESFIPKYYKYLNDWGIEAKAHGEINAGLKIHDFIHIPDMIQAFGGKRLAYGNDERDESVVQKVGKAFQEYIHFHGRKRIIGAMRKCNLKTLKHVFCSKEFCDKILNDL
eukprot:476903_1